MHDHGFAWALTLSILLHLAALTQLPSFRVPAAVKNVPLSIELVAPEVVEAEPAEIAQPAPEPPQPIKPKPEPRPEPAPNPVAKPTPQPEPAPAPPMPAVITAAPTEKPPVIVAPPPPAPPAPSQQDLDAARNRYGSLLASQIARHKQYPKIAQMRGWQGEVVIELEIDSNGSVVSSKIHEASPYTVLDRQALSMVQKAAPFPKPPEILRGNLFKILVPVSFRLE